MVGAFATLTILTKNSLMENLSQDYVRTAFAKGLSERRVIFVHALRNSLIPIVTGLGHAISLVLAGSFLIEKVFNIDGMGYLGYTAILQRDYPVALGILVISSLLMLLGNILSDIIYAFVDPRIRFR
jgi:microcin C transport system permease protein